MLKNMRRWRSLAKCLILVGVVTALATGKLPAVLAKDHGERQTVNRDWKEFPAITQLSTAGDIVAVGDVHGDYKRLVRLLVAGKLVPDVPDSPAKIQWSGGKTVLVCTGDLIDKGKHSLDVIECFRALQKKAEADGGRVIVTMGNHEAEFLADPDDDEKAERFLKELDDENIDPDDVADGKDARGIGESLRNMPFAAHVNDWFFSHACNTKGLALATLDHELRESVNRDGFGAEILVGDEGLLEARLKPRPWWERKHDSAQDSESRLRGYAEALGIKHFVMGHQPGKAVFSDDTKRKKGEMIQKFDGLIFLIDVGMSKAIDYQPGTLLIIRRANAHESAISVGVDGTQSQLWPDR